MNDVISITLKDVYLPTSNLKINGIRLRKFQEELYKDLDNYNEICLQAPTGSGKTFSLLIMLAKLATQKLPLPVVGIYPSRVLVYDQGKSVKNILEKAGFKDEGNGRFSGKIEVEENSKILASTDEIKVTVVELTSERKKELLEKSSGEKATKEDVLDILINYRPSPKNYLILLTVPEYPFMYISHLKDVNLYFGKIIEYVVKGKTDLGDLFSKPWIRDIFTEFSKYFYGYFFIDEFHLYSGLARASLFTLKRMIDDFASDQPIKPKFVFSSATPSQMQCEKVITAQSSNEGDKIRKRTKLVFHLEGKNPQQDLVDCVSKAKFDKKTMIILDRAYYIAELCQKIEADLVWGLDISYGLCKKLQKVEDEKVIVGNNAISFGIDIPYLDLGFIHAHDAETAIQRIGRFGRHGEGEAEVHVFLEPKYNVVNALNQYSNKEITFEEFLQLVESLYKRREDDKLDKIFFSIQRSEIMFNAYLILKGISNSEIVYKNGKFYKVEGGQEVKPLNFSFNIRPSTDDYFKVFAFRAGGLKGKWCKDEKQNKQEEDDLFTMLRNFRYDVERQCFTTEPLKQNPEAVIEDIPGEFEPFEKFYRIANPKIIINKGGSISLRQISGIEDSYVITLTEMPEWKNFSEMVRLVATYESALPACLDKNFDYDKLKCKKVDALLLFI